MKRLLILSTSGFSLAEVMIALAIGSIGMMGFMKMYDNQLKASKRQLAVQDVLSLMSQVQTAVMTPKGCMANFASLESPYTASSKVPIDGIYIGNLSNGTRISPIIKFNRSTQGANAPIGTFSSIQIRDAYLDIPGFKPGLGAYQGSLILQVEQAGQPGSFYGTREMKTNPIPILIYTDESNKIIACNEVVAPTIISSSPGPSPVAAPNQARTMDGKSQIHDARVPVQNDLPETPSSEVVNPLIQNIFQKVNEPSKAPQVNFRSLVESSEPTPTTSGKIYTCICKTRSDVSCQSKQSEVMQTGQSTCIGPPGMEGVGQTCSWVCY